MSQLGMTYNVSVFTKGGSVNHYPWTDCPGGKATLQKTPGLLSVSLNKVSSPSAGQQGDSRSWE